MEGCEISYKGETVEVSDFQPISIEQDKNIFIINFESNKEEYISLSINEKNQLYPINYIKKMNFNEIKDLNKVFCVLNSIIDFYHYLKSLANDKKIRIKKYDDKITLILIMEVLYKEYLIEIDLFPSRNSMALNIKTISEELMNIKEKIKEIDILKKEINNLDEQNKEKLKEIDNLRKEINNLNEEKKEKSKEINKLKDEIRVIKMDNETLKNNNSELNKELNILKNNFRDINEIINNFKKEIISLKEQNNKNIELTKKINSFKISQEHIEIKQMNQNNYDEEDPKQIIIKSQIKDNLLLNHQKNQTNFNEIEQNEEIVKRKGKKKRNKKGKKPCNKEFTDKKIDVEFNKMKNEIQNEEEKKLNKDLVIEEDKEDNNDILIKGKKLRNIDNNISYDEFDKNTIEMNSDKNLYDDEEEKKEQIINKQKDFSENVNKKKRKKGKQSAYNKLINSISTNFTDNSKHEIIKIQDNEAPNFMKNNKNIY